MTKIFFFSWLIAGNGERSETERVDVRRRRAPSIVDAWRGVDAAAAVATRLLALLPPTRSDLLHRLHSLRSVTENVLLSPISAPARAPRSPPFRVLCWVPPGCRALPAIFVVVRPTIAAFDQGTRALLLPSANQLST